MKRLLATVLILVLCIGFIPTAEPFSYSVSAKDSTAYSETKITAPEFSRDKYYKLYDENGKALTCTHDGVSVSLTFEEARQGDKAQEWQIASDIANPLRYRIISKLTGKAIAPESTSRVSLYPVDLNSAEQEWSFTPSSGEFSIRMSGKNRLTYSQNKLKLTASGSSAKQFEIYEINNAQWVEDWSDEFSGELDETKWNRADGHLQGAEAVVTNVGDKEHVYTENGDLVLRTTVGDYGGYDAAAGMVDTAGKYYMTYGKVEMRAKLPCGYGTFPALWMLGTENIWPGNGEIDIMEISNDGAEDKDSYLYGTLHWAADNGAHVSEGMTVYNEGKVPLAADYHTYALEWEYDQIRMYFDGILYFSFNIDNDVKRFAYGDEPHFLILDNWLLGNNKGKLFDDKEYKNEYIFRIDSIKTYKRANSADFIADETTAETTVYSTAADVIARSHDWDNRMPMAISPDGAQIAVADGLGMLYIIDGESFLQKERILTFPMRELSAIAYSPDGKRLAVANLIGTVLIYDTSDYSAQPLSIYNGSVNCEQLIFSEDSSKLIVSGISRRAVHYGGANQFDGQYVTPECVRVFSVSSGERLFETSVGGEVRAMALSMDGELLALAMLDGRCVILETENYIVTAELKCGDVQLHGVEFSADGKKLAVGDEAGEIYIWDASSNTLIRKLDTVTKTSITKVAFSPNGEQLLVNSSDNCARIYEVSNGKLKAILGGFAGIARFVSYSPDGENIAVGSYDGRVKLYTSAGEYLRTLVTSHTENNGRLFDMDFSPNGEYIYATVYSFPKAVHRWRVDGTQEAFSADYCSDFIYEISDGEVKILAYRGNDRDIILPDYIEGCPVTSIGENAFFYFGNYIRNVNITLPATIKRIERRAFYNVWSLRRIVLPEGLEYIGADAFHGCKQLYEIVIPDSVTEIGIGAFDWCHGLERVVIGAGMKKVTSGIFGTSRGITEAIFKNGVEDIESKVFSVCELKKVYFASSVTSCASDAFEGAAVIYGETGSYAQEYASQEQRLSFAEKLLGDADGDGVLTVSDALQVLRQSIELTYAFAEISDVDTDGQVTVSDALFILRRCAGII